MSCAGFPSITRATHADGVTEVGSVSPHRFGPFFQLFQLQEVIINLLPQSRVVRVLNHLWRSSLFFSFKTGSDLIQHDVVLEAEWVFLRKTASLSALFFKRPSGSDQR